MLPFVFGLPLLIALLCLALNQRVTTRLLGILSAAGLLVSGALLVGAVAQNDLSLVTYDWATLDGLSLLLSFTFDGLTLPLALVLTFGGALTMAVVALSLPAQVRGFGGLIAALTVTIVSTLLGISLSESILLPFSWALVAVMSFITLRQSGPQAQGARLPLALLAGVVGALSLLGTALATQVPGETPTASALIGATLAALLATGGLFFHDAIDELATAPAGVAAVIIGLGLPVLGMTSLLRFATAQGAELPGWQQSLAVLGALILLSTAAGALRERRMAHTIGWLISGQTGLLFIDLSRSLQSIQTVAPAVVLNTMLSTLAALLAVAVLERHHGTDDIRSIQGRMALLVPGIAFTIAAASLVGVPGTFGFWVREWLLSSTDPNSRWLTPVVLASSTLSGLALLSSAMAFWRSGAPGDQHAPAREQLSLLPMLAVLPVVALGIWPQLLWNEATRQAMAETASAPPFPGLSGALGNGIAALLLGSLPLVLQRRAWRGPADADERASVMAPDALAASLAPLAWLAAPTGLLARVWEALLALANGTRRLLGLFEQRYYIAGMIIALVVVIMLMI